MARTPRYAAFVAIPFLSIAGSALADQVTLAGNYAASSSNLGTFTGTLSYVVDNATTGTLTFNLTNTTAAGGGYITGLVFNLPSVGDAVLASTTNPAFINTGAESASPFGTFDAGAALGANWLGGGSPTAGVGVGQSITLTFTVTASNAAALSAAQFIGYAGETNIALRFRGFANGGSDKVPVTSNPPPPVVPAPSAAAGLAFGVLAAGRRRRPR